MYLYNWFRWISVVVFATYAIAGTSPEALRLTRLTEESEDQIIRITDGSLEPFTGVRDYHTLLIMTSSSDAHGCVSCDSITRAAKLVAKSYFKDYLPFNSLFFVEVDLKYEPNFQIANAIQLNTVPHIWLVPPNSKEQYDPMALVKEPHFDFKVPKGNIQNQAFEMAQFVSKNVQRSILLRDEDPLQTFLLFFCVTFLAIMLFKKRGPKILTNLGKSFVYKVLVLVAILASTTGYQFTKIQKVPFIARNEKGIIFVSGGTHYQFGIETVIVSGNYALLGIAFVTLIYLGNYKSTPKSLFNDKFKDYLVIVNVVILYCLYSTLTSLALRKDHDYPYYFSKLF